ncbi:hypothetical protein [Pseudomonas sp. 2FE]|nr:hypothetical protein [Pseudomonas sp. 2FE]
MNDDLIFLKLAGVLLVAFLVFMWWRGRGGKDDGAWPPGEY